MWQPMLAIDIPELLRSQYARFLGWLSELDQRLTVRYGDHYNNFKQQFVYAKTGMKKKNLKPKVAEPFRWSKNRPKSFVSLLKLVQQWLKKKVLLRCS
jgi:hypothetical protein